MKLSLIAIAVLFAFLCGDQALSQTQGDLVPIQCGAEWDDEQSTAGVACIDFDALQALTPIVRSGKEMQFLIFPKDIRVIALRITVYGPGGERVVVSDVVNDANGRRLAQVPVDRIDWERARIQFLGELH